MSLVLILLEVVLLLVSDLTMFHVVLTLLVDFWISESKCFFFQLLWQRTRFYDISYNMLYNLGPYCFFRLHKYCVLWYKRFCGKRYSDINTWFKNNLLNLNFSKTHYLEFRSMKHNKLNMQIHHNHNYISNATQTKFFGLTIDDTLSWKHRIGQVIKIMSSATMPWGF